MAGYLGDGLALERTVVTGRRTEMVRNLLSVRVKPLLGALVGTIALASVIVGVSDNAWPAEMVTAVTLDDQAFATAVYPLQEGLVKSESITVKTSLMSVPALLTALGARQFDVFSTAALAPPLLAARGVKVKILSVQIIDRGWSGIFVRKDSAIQSADQLKGRRLAVPAIGATATALMRAALHRKFGLNVDRKEGDVRFQEIPGDVMLGQLDAGRVDAGFLWHEQFFKARENPNFRLIFQPGPVLKDIAGLPPSAAVFVAYPETLSKRAKALTEFNRLLRASVEYVHSRPNEVFEALARKRQYNAPFLSWWYASGNEFHPATLGEQEIQSVKLTWQLGKEIGDIAEMPDIEQFLWREGAVTR